MDYLSRCYRATVRPFRDSGRTVTIRWYFCAPGAQLYPGIHLFGSQVWRPDPDDPDGPGELFGSKPYDPGTNPGYVGQCHQGPDDWYGQGVPSGAIVGPPVPLPECCFRRPSAIAGDKTGWTGFTLSRPRDIWGLRVGFTGLSRAGTVGYWGLASGRLGSVGRGVGSSWGLLDGLAGGTGRGVGSSWGLLDGLAGGTGRGVGSSWGLLDGLAGGTGLGLGGTWGLLDGMGDRVALLICQVQQAAPQSIAHNADVPLSWSGVITDPSGMWSAGQPTRMTVPRAGLYLLISRMFWNALPTGTQSFDGYKVNGGVVTYGNGYVVSLAMNASVPQAWVLVLNAGDYVEITAHQNSVGSVNTLTGVGVNTTAMLVWLGTP